MSITEDSDDYLRWDKGDSFDWDSVKPYSSCWVSTRKESKTQRDKQANTDTKINVMPSRAYNDLHSLLENIQQSRSSINTQKDNTESTLVSTTKSDFVLSPHKLLDKSDTSMKRIPDKIIESMCKNETSDNKSCPNHTCETNIKDYEKSAEDKQSNETLTQDNESDNDRSSSDIEVLAKRTSLQQSNDNETINLGGGEPVGNRRRTNSGTLIAEINLTSLVLRDSLGRDVPINIKYVWETDPKEIIQSMEKVFHPSQGLLETIDILSNLTLSKDYNNMKKEDECNIMDTESDACDSSFCHKVKNNSNEAVENNCNSAEDKEHETVQCTSEIKSKFNKQPSKLSVYRSKILVNGSAPDKKPDNEMKNETKLLKTNERKNKKTDSLNEFGERKVAFTNKKKPEDVKTVTRQRSTRLLRNESIQKQNTWEQGHVKYGTKPPSAPTSVFTATAIRQKKSSIQNMERVMLVKRAYGSNKPSTTNNQLVVSGRQNTWK